MKEEERTCPLHDMVHGAVNSCVRTYAGVAASAMDQKDLYRNIVIIGGGTNLSGLDRRLRRELTQSLNTPASCHITSGELPPYIRTHAAWLGAAQKVALEVQRAKQAHHARMGEQREQLQLLQSCDDHDFDLPSELLELDFENRYESHMLARMRAYTSGPSQANPRTIDDEGASTLVDLSRSVAPNHVTARWLLVSAPGGLAGPFQYR